jgi:hypothetical protein
VAVDVALVLVIGVLGAEDGGTDGTSEVLNVVFAVEGGDVGSAQCIAASEADQVEAAEVVSLAQRVLIGAFVGDGEELGGYYLAAFLERGVRAWSAVSGSRSRAHTRGGSAYMTCKALEMVGRVEGSHELATKRIATFGTNPRAAGSPCARNELLLRLL